MTKTFTAIVKLESIKDVKLGKSAAKELSGEQLSDGKSWKKAFFANNKELRDQLNDVEVGDTIAVEMEKDDKYWNISAIRQAEDEEIEKAESYNSKSERSEGKSGGSPAVRRADGGSRGDDTNRSAAIYLAREIVLMSKEVPTSAEKIAEKVAKIADTFIYPYIKDGLVPVVVEEDKPARKPRKTNDDPLAPPDIED